MNRFSLNYKSTHKNAICGKFMLTEKQIENIFVNKTYVDKPNLYISKIINYLKIKNYNNINKTRIEILTKFYIDRQNTF